VRPFDTMLNALGDVLDHLARLLGLRPARRPAVVRIETRRPGRSR